MNKEKIGALLLSLRREQGLTQRALAQRLHVSDKTISKWERGAGMPDIAMLPALSVAFGVDMERLLQGDLAENPTNGGNMKRVKFYVCPHCGNTILATGGENSACCGRILSPLTPQVADEAHDLTVESVDMDYYITFPHPMEKAHYLSFAAYVDLDRTLLIKLYPEQERHFRIPRMHGGTLYYHCNTHGLFVKKLP